MPGTSTHRLILIRGAVLSACPCVVVRVTAEFKRFLGLGALKSDGIEQVVCGDSLTFDQEHVNLMDLDSALQRFSDEDPRAAHLVVLRFFAGLTLEDAAETLGISRSTAKRDRDRLVPPCELAQVVERTRRTSQNRLMP